MGANLRDAQVNAMKESDVDGIDKIVHAMYKLLGHLGSHPARVWKGCTMLP